ncbi:uncharacterized protein LOC143448565 [Clavelina lepadiformis]|uniref:uncharacterized protein LOC143448565 n=1 Tax=Clavelina lepadiformis TaxID=159417 RepID=UPI0040426F0E
MTPRTILPVPSEPYKRWNFRKANWELYSLTTNELAQDLPPPDTGLVDEAYQDFCSAIVKPAKRSIPRGRRNNYRPCCDAECESLYQAFLKAQQGEASKSAASALHARLDEKRREGWTEAVNTIDLRHSSLLLVKNGVYGAKDHKSAYLVNNEVTELWRIPTPPGETISVNFTPEEFASTLQLLKFGKAPGPDSICPELIIHAGAALKSWLNKFLSSCLHTLKLQKIWRKALVVVIPKPMKPIDDPKSYRPISLLCIPFNILERLIYARVEPIIDPLLPQEQAGFDTEDQPWTKLLS